MLEVNEYGTSLRTELFSEDGERLQDLGADFLTWREWRRRARLPAASTSLETSSVTAAGGSFTTWLYTVTDGATVQRFHYAKDLPGPPVLSTMEVAGVEVSRTELLERGVDPALVASIYVPPAMVQRWRPRVTPRGLKRDPSGSARCAVDVWIDTSGEVLQARAAECAPGAEGVSLAYARNFEFTPATLDGVPLPSTCRVVFEY